MRAPAPARRARWRHLLAGRRAGIAVVVAGLLLAGAVAASLAVGGYRRSQLLLSSGTVWLASPQGLVTLVDGPSEQVIGNVRIGTGGSGPAPEVVQVGTSALVVDQQAGTIARIDGATYAVTGPLPFGPGGPLQVLAAGRTAYVVDGPRREAVVIDTTTLARKGTIPLGAAPGPGQAVVDGSGSLWVQDARSGGLVRADRSGAVTRFSGTGSGGSRLAVAGGRPVLVDVAGGRLGRLDDAGRVASWDCTGLRLGTDPQLLSAAGAGRLYAAVGDTGELLLADPGHGRCATRQVAPPGTALGRPVTDDGFVLVPDRATGQAIVVDPANRRVVAREQLVPAGAGFQLVAEDGLVFYNDAAGPDAGVVRYQQGEWVAGPPVAKFATGNVPSLAAADTGLPSDGSLAGLPLSPSAPTSTVSQVVVTPAAPTTRSAPTTTATPTTITTTWTTPTTTATTWTTPTTTASTTPTTTTTSPRPPVITINGGNPPRAPAG